MYYIIITPNYTGICTSTDTHHWHLRLNCPNVIYSVGALERKRCVIQIEKKNALTPSCELISSSKH